jgi:hypothetical protein
MRRLSRRRLCKLSVGHIRAEARPNKRLERTAEQRGRSTAGRSAVRRHGRAADVARTLRWGAAGARAMEGVGRSDESRLGPVGSA